MTKDEYILECDVILNKIFYKSDAPWIIEQSAVKNPSTETISLQFSWIKNETQHRVHLFRVEITEPVIEIDKWVTITDVISLMEEPEDYRFAIQCILSCDEFVEDIDDPLYISKLEKLKNSSWDLV